METYNGPSFESLPNEILSPICEYLVAEDQPYIIHGSGNSEALYNLSLVSKNFAVMAQPVLYRLVVLSEDTVHRMKRPLLFLRTIFENPELGACVKHITSSTELPTNNISKGEMTVLKQAYIATGCDKRIKWETVFQDHRRLQTILQELTLLMLPNLEYVKIDSPSSEMTLLPALAQEKGRALLSSLKTIDLCRDELYHQEGLRTLLSVSGATEVIARARPYFGSLSGPSPRFERILKLDLQDCELAAACLSELFGLCPNLQALRYTHEPAWEHKMQRWGRPWTSANDVVTCLYEHRHNLRSLHLSMEFSATTFSRSQLPEAWTIPDMSNWSRLRDPTIDRYDLTSSWGFCDENNRDYPYFLLCSDAEVADYVLQDQCDPFLWKLPHCLQNLCITRGDRGLLPELEQLPDLIDRGLLPRLRSVQLAHWYHRCRQGWEYCVHALAKTLLHDHKVRLEIMDRRWSGQNGFWSCKEHELEVGFEATSIA